jgi:hypothetical protein
MNLRLCAYGASLAVLLLVDAAAAAPLPTVAGISPPQAAVKAQALPRTREFRRCMRSNYGPRYFAGVKRAHRWHMAQACMA